MLHWTKRNGIFKKCSISIGGVFKILKEGAGVVERKIGTGRWSRPVFHSPNFSKARSRVKCKRKLLAALVMNDTKSRNKVQKKPT